MGGVDDLFALRFRAFRVFRALGGVDDPVCTKIHSVQSVQSVGGVNDLFAIRFTAFTVFRAFPQHSERWGVDDLFANPQHSEHSEHEGCR